MNKIIYAIGIAIATTFVSNTKPAVTKTDEKGKQEIKQVEKSGFAAEMDSIKVKF